jgi:hypothetical protein
MLHRIVIDQRPPDNAQRRDDAPSNSPCTRASLRRSRERAPTKPSACCGCAELRPRAGGGAGAARPAAPAVGKAAQRGGSRCRACQGSQGAEAHDPDQGVAGRVAKGTGRGGDEVGDACRRNQQLGGSQLRLRAARQGRGDRDQLSPGSMHTWLQSLFPGPELHQGAPQGPAQSAATPQPRRACRRGRPLRTALCAPCERLLRRRYAGRHRWQPGGRARCSEGGGPAGACGVCRAPRQQHWQQWRRRASQGHRGLRLHGTSAAAARASVAAQKRRAVEM